MLKIFFCVGDMYYISALEEIEFESQDFRADSWSMAVDSSYLQTHRKHIINRQDVIYGDNNFLLLHCIDLSLTKCMPQDSIGVI